MQLTLTYGGQPPVRDVLEAEPARPGVATLTSHGYYTHLAPGDVVEHDDAGEIIGITALSPLFVYEIEFPLPVDTVTGMRPSENHPALQRIQALLEEWRSAVAITRTTAFTAQVSSPTQAPLTPIINHRLVTHHQLQRTPATTYDIDAIRVRPPHYDLS